MLSFKNFWPEVTVSIVVVVMQEASGYCMVPNDNPVKFKNTLKNFFHQHPFYSIKQYFEHGNATRGSFE